MKVAIVGGAGTIGTTTAFALRAGPLHPDVTLVDSDADASLGHAIDLVHGGYHDRTAGTVSSASPCPRAVADADCVVVTASVPRPAGGDERGGRRTFLPGNNDVVADVSACLREIDPVPVVVVTNPVDYVTQRLHEATGWEREWFVGYSLSESARAAYKLAELTDSPFEAVRCPTMGEHGERVVPVVSRATAAGAPVSLAPSEREELLEYVREVPYRVVGLRGASDSSRWVTGPGVARVVETIFGERAETLCLSTPLDGEYGVKDASLSVPLELSPSGVATIREWELSAWEYGRFRAAADAVRATLTEYRPA